jgi:hypothetical protein
MPSRAGLLTATNSSLSLYGGPFPFYPNWVIKTGKPFLFSETGAAIVYDIDGSIVRIKATEALELRIKQAWWNEILSETIYAEQGTKLSRAKAVVWFEEIKPEVSYDNANIYIMRDYRVTYNTTVRNALKNDLAAAGNRITYPGKFQFKCNGEFLVKQ